uniref:Uncharacterized protein n=1 Tax=uncultured bacterium Contig1522a TaxID=1393448 RepID=W0FGW0_9BACT|nr:hypothetical protein [uncultured bacterium Contig1522a]
MLFRSFSRLQNPSPDEIVKSQKDPLKRKGYRQLETIRIKPEGKSNPTLAFPGGRIERLSGDRQGRFVFLSDSAARTMNFP